MSAPLSIIVIGDIVGKLGRRTVAELVPKWRELYKADLVIANGENMAHGKGISLLTAQEVLASGIDWLTSGDHCFDQPSSIDACFNGELPILRPENYADEAPGKGNAIIKIGEYEILLLNLIGRSFMQRHYNCPFRTAERILDSFTGKKFSAIIIDIHAETTAEKIALRHFLNGKISALLGTHTHVPTADAQITDKGTAYITDLGMTGDADGVIGVSAEAIVTSFLTQTKVSHILADHGRAQCGAVHLSIDPETGRCLKITQLQEIIKFAS